MRYIFFCFYNSQYLDGKNKVNLTPWINAVGMMFAGSFCWLGIFLEIYYFYILNQNFPGMTLTELAILFIVAFIHYYLFIKDRKYELIYEEFKSSKLNKRTNNILFILTYLFFPAIAMMFIAMKWHKVI